MRAIMADAVPESARSNSTAQKTSHSLPVGVGVFFWRENPVLANRGRHFG